MKPLFTPSQMQDDYEKAARKETPVDYLFLNKYRSNSKQDKMIKIEE